MPFPGARSSPSGGGGGGAVPGRGTEGTEQGPYSRHSVSTSFLSEGGVKRSRAVAKGICCSPTSCRSLVPDLGPAAAPTSARDLTPLFLSQLGNRCNSLCHSDTIESRWNWAAAGVQLLLPRKVGYSWCNGSQAMPPFNCAERCLVCRLLLCPIFIIPS